MIKFQNQPELRRILHQLGIGGENALEGGSIVHVNDGRLTCIPIWGKCRFDLKWQLFLDEMELDRSEFRF